MARHNNSNTAITVVAIVLLLAAGFVWWFFENFEQYDKERYVGYSGEAARNAYYAAELFLKKYQTEVEPVTTILHMKEMPDTSDILFIPTKRFDISEEKLDEIWQWVEEGGHLVALARFSNKKDEKVDDTLFARLNVTTHRDPDALEFIEPFLEFFEKQEKESKAKKDSDKPLKDKTGNGKKEDKKSKTKIPGMNREPLTVKGTKEIEDKQVVFIQSRWMEYEDRDELIWAVSGHKGAQLLEYRIGNGRITLLSDMRFMLNSQISKYDHASFLHMLVHVDDTERKLWFIKHGDSPSLFSILLDKASPAVYSLLFLIIFWLWYASRRFGPIYPNPEAVRRSMREHIESTGHYQWRNKNRYELLQSVQKGLHEQIAQTRPLWVKLSEDELSEKLASLARLDKQKVYVAITTKSVERELEFVALIETLSLLRKKL